MLHSVPRMMPKQEKDPRLLPQVNVQLSAGSVGLCVCLLVVERVPDSLQIDCETTMNARWF
jgi:hypothetical protein